MEINYGNVPMVNDVRRVRSQEEYEFYKGRGYENLRYLPRQHVGTVKKRISKAEQAELTRMIEAAKQAENAAQKAAEAARKAALKAEAERIKAERKAARDAKKALKVNANVNMSGMGAVIKENAAIDQAVKVIAGEEVAPKNDEEMMLLDAALAKLGIGGGKRKTRKAPRKSKKSHKTRYNRRA